MAGLARAEVERTGIKLTPEDWERLFPGSTVRKDRAGLVADPSRVLDQLGAIVERNAAENKVASNAQIGLTANLSNTVAGTFLTTGIAVPIITLIAQGGAAADLYPFLKPFAVCAVAALSIHLLGRRSLEAMRA